MAAGDTTVGSRPITDFEAPEQTFALLRRLVERSGRPLSVSLLEGTYGPMTLRWRDVLDWAVKATADGLPIKAQVLSRTIGVMLGHELTLNPFYTCKSYIKLECGAEDEVTLHWNRSVFETLRFVPITLVDTSARHQRIDLFGREASSPLIIAPTALNSMQRHRGDLALARAAAATGIPFSLGSRPRGDWQPSPLVCQ